MAAWLGWFLLVVVAAWSTSVSSSSLPVTTSVAIGLGANLPSPAGAPLDTLVALRPQLESLLHHWGGEGSRVHWSPLFRTAPVGGPAGQPDYLNAALVAQVTIAPSLAAALELLNALQQLELSFGRQRLEHWGARTLDLDLLWWDNLRCEHPVLELPHPRWHQRGFVLAPLEAIERCLGSPLPLPEGVASVSTLLAASADAAAICVTPAPSSWP
jgi:2-amino-4-hydroxy-6-hydroxymethyldihydropteridine diphosphokinase